MDLLYSWSLSISLVAGAIGLLLGMLALLRRATPDQLSEASMRARLVSVRTAFAATMLGALGLIISVIVHWRWAHGPASEEPMAMTRFVFSHQAFPVAGLVIVAGFAMIACARKRERR